MALLIIGGIGYALLIMFVLGAMMLSGRASDREERRLQPLRARTERSGHEHGELALPVSRRNAA